MSAGAFTVYAVDSPRMARTFKAKLERLRSDLAVVIASPGMVTNWDDYQRRVGVIEGIDEALRVCDDIEKEAEERR